MRLVWARLKRGGAGLLLAGVMLLAGGPARALSPATYRIGFLANASGPVAIESESFLRGARLAVTRIEETEYLPAGVHLQLQVEEGGDDLAGALAGLGRLLDDPGVLAAACCVGSRQAEAAAALAADARMPVVLLGPGGGGLARPPWAYSVAGWPSADEAGLARRLARGLRLASAAFFAAADDAAMIRRAMTAQTALAQVGVPSRGLFRAPATDSDFTVPATAITAAAPDLLMIFAPSAASGALVQAVRGRGWGGHIAATEALSPMRVERQYGPVLADIPFATDFSEIDTHSGTAFARAYQARFGEQTDPYAARGYAAVWLLAQALRGLPGRPDRAALGKSLAGLGPLDLNLYGGEALRAGQLVVHARRFLAWTGAAGLIRWSPAGAAE